MLQKRTKPVNIRVSEDEFRMLREAGEKAGQWNLSELAREAMKQIVDTQKAASATGQDISSWLNELDCRLDNLQAEVKRLKKLIETSR